MSSRRSIRVEVPYAGFPQLDFTVGIGGGEGAHQAGQRGASRSQREADTR